MLFYSLILKVVSPTNFLTSITNILVIPMLFHICHFFMNDFKKIVDYILN